MAMVEEVNKGMFVNWVTNCTCIWYLLFILDDFGFCTSCSFCVNLGVFPQARFIVNHGIFFVDPPPQPPPHLTPPPLPNLWESVTEKSNCWVAWQCWVALFIIFLPSSCNLWIYEYFFLLFFVREFCVFVNLWEWIVTKQKNKT